MTTVTATRSELLSRRSRRAPGRAEVSDGPHAVASAATIDLAWELPGSGGAGR